MRVLAVGNMYPPHHFGGYELVWQGAVDHLRSLGHEVRVVTSDVRLDDRAADSDPEVHRDLRWWWRDHVFPELSIGDRVRLVKQNLATFDRHLAEHRPDVVSWWSMGGMTLSLVEDARRRGLPAVGFVHDDWLDYGPRVDQWLNMFRGGRAPLGALAGRAVGLPAHVDWSGAARWVFVSETTRRRAISARGPLAATGVAHSGIDPAYLDLQPERDWRWRLLYAGRMDLRKGITDAVEALAHLPAEATLTVVGEGNPEAVAAVRAAADRAGAGERVLLDGFRSRDELRSAYADCDVLVFPATWEEPWGLVPLEAMALGRPVVATGRGGSGEYLRDGENALLFAAGDPAALASAVRRLASDPALRARLRDAGLATARENTADHFNAAVAREVEAAAR